MERRGSKGWDEFTSNDIRVGGDYMEMGWIEERGDGVHDERHHPSWLTLQCEMHNCHHAFKLDQRPMNPGRHTRWIIII